MIELELSAWDVRKHVGFLRNLVLRKAYHTNEIMVNIITSKFNEMKLLPIVQNLIGRFPNIKSIVNNITSRHSGSTQGQSEHILYGKPVIHEKLGNYTFEISSTVVLLAICLCACISNNVKKDCRPTVA